VSVLMRSEKLKIGGLQMPREEFDKALAACERPL